MPFCAALCDYCDFYSVPVRPGLDRFLELLLRETEDRLARFGTGGIPTLYIGGGTPSVLGAERMGRFLAGLHAMLPQWPAEVTVEVNPESADREFLTACREGGVNRLSAGVQTFHEASRRLVRRIGDASLLDERLALISSIYKGAFSADLITGLPGQDEEVLLKDISRLLSYKPGHASLYALTVTEGTPLAAAPPAGLPSEDEADRLWLLGRDALEAAGLAQYEVSNFALPSRRCTHNARYWRMESWIGIGPAASTTLVCGEDGAAEAVHGQRYTQAPDVEAYLAAWPEPPPPQGGEYLDSRTLMKETLLMGFRCIDGPDREGFIRRFHRDIGDCIPRTLERWRGRGMAVRGGIALNREGLLFLNRFLEEAFEEMDNP